jgi:hypothetical protein
MTDREELVTVKTKDGGWLAFSHGRCSLILAAGETADKWLDGSPITRGEFENVLAPHAEVEIVANIFPGGRQVEPAPAAMESRSAKKNASSKMEE